MDAYSMSNSVVILMALHSLVLLSSYCQGRQHFLGQLPPSRCAQILSLIRLAILLCFAIAKNGDRHQNVCVCAGTTEEAGTIQWRPEGKKRHWGGKQEELQLGDRSKSAQTHLMPFFFCWAFFELWACLCVSLQKQLNIALICCCPLLMRQRTSCNSST